MPTITEAELARLEELRTRSEESYVPYGGTTPATTWYQLEACSAVPDLIETIRAQRTALIAWQFQAAGAALMLQRLMDAGLKMRGEQRAWEYIINSATQESASNVVNAEDAFDDLLAGILSDMQGADGNNDRP